MPKKKYVLKSVVGHNQDGTIAGEETSAFRPFERNLLDLSSAGIKWNTNLIKSSRTAGTEENVYGQYDMFTNTGIDRDPYSALANFSGQNDYIAFFDQQYAVRREFLRKFALQSEIEYVVDQIADETIVNDDLGYFAYPDTKNLKARLKADNGKEIVDDINASFRRVYNAWKFNEGDDAWHWVKKFLVDGFLCFEIIYDYELTPNGEAKATEIIGFKELDPLIMQPKIKYDKDGNEYKVWVLNEGDSEKERELLDTHVIYISWAKNNFISRTSYIEKLVRPFNMLRTIENSHVIWNVQNAQKRINVTIPSEVSTQRGRSRLNELMAYFKEDISIDNSSGELMVNGQPKFQFYKTFFTPSKGGSKVEISEISTEGHNMNTTESLKYYWQRYIISTELPKDRFSMMFDSQSAVAYPDKGSMTKEEYKFSLFIKRLRDIIQELLVKPTWLQFCIKHPNFATNDVLKSSFGITYIEENIFEKERERAMLEAGANTIQTLRGIMRADGKTPLFASRYLFEKFLMLSEDEWKMNDRYLKEEQDELKQQSAQGQQGAAPVAPGAPGMGGLDMGAGMDIGGASDMGGGMDMGGGAPDMGGFTEPQGFDTGGGASVGDNFEAGGEVAAPSGGEAPM